MFTRDIGQYLRQTIEAAEWGEKVVAKIIRNAVARGAKVTMIQDEIIIEEGDG